MQALRRSPRLRQLPTAPIPPTPPIPPTAPIPQTPPAMHNLGLFDNEACESAPPCHWTQMEHQLDEQGCARLRGLLDAQQCRDLAALYAREDGFRSRIDRKSTRLNSSHLVISYAVFCLKKKKETAG